MERFDPAWALRPEALELLAVLVGEGRTTVVECGSGLSTVTLARALRGRDEGHVHALEHSPEWATTTREALGAERLERFATVIEAPLRDGWYHRAALGELPADGVDLLVVDGPPANEPGIERSRYPALPTLAERLAPGAAIVLDDADRAGERWAFCRWLAEFELVTRPSPPGTALALYVPPAGRASEKTRRGRHERNS